MTDAERRQHIDAKVNEAYAIVAEAIEEHVTEPGKRLAGEVLLFSGGDDSTVLAHIFRNDVDYLAHINTGIGIEETRQFVRDTAQSWDVPLIEEHGNSYEELVIRYGFPGPSQHFRMYNNLKERGLRKVRRRLVTHGRRERVLFIAGMRRDESKRRGRNVERHHREGSTVWVSPLIEWSKQDLNDYRTLHPSCPRNPVAAELHMSGECLCGSFAKPGELDEIEFWRPKTAAYIRSLEDKVLTAGNVPPEKAKWGWGAYRRVTPKDTAKLGPLCSQCSLFEGDVSDGLPIGSEVRIGPFTPGATP